MDMKRVSQMTACLILANSVAGVSMLAGCADESAPNRRGIERPALINESTDSKANAEHRELEGRQRELPTSGGSKEFPGQSKLDDEGLSDRPIAMLSDKGSADPDCGGSCCKPGKPKASAPGESYTDYRPVMKKGQTAPVPGTGYSIDPSWGSEQPLASAEHRPWPLTTVRAESPGVQHNPYYTRPLLLGIPDDEGTAMPSIVDAVEIPWWYFQLATIPVQAVFNPPLAQNSTHQPIETGKPRRAAGIYEAYLPAAGPIHPAPVPGKFQFVYPFDNQTPERNAGGVQRLEPANAGQSVVTTTPSTQPRPRPGGVIEK
jgi:hypothetical protein